MTEGIWTAIVSGIFATVIGIIEAVNVKERKKAFVRMEMQEQESRLSMKMVSANCKLGVVTAKAVTGQHTNGDVEEAMIAAAKAQNEYDEFLRDIVRTAIVRG